MPTYAICIYIYFTAARVSRPGPLSPACPARPAPRARFPYLVDPASMHPSTAFRSLVVYDGYSISSPGDLPNPGIEPGSPILQTDALPSEPPVHGLIFETSICYWQDQPGRGSEHEEPGVPGKRGREARDATRAPRRASRKVPLRGEGSCGSGGAPRDSAGSGATEEGLTSRGDRNLRFPLRFGLRPQGPCRVGTGE